MTSRGPFRVGLDRHLAPVTVAALTGGVAVSLQPVDQRGYRGTCQAQLLGELAGSPGRLAEQPQGSQVRDVQAQCLGDRRVQQDGVAKRRMAGTYRFMRVLDTPSC